MALVEMRSMQREIGDDLFTVRANAIRANETLIAIPE